MQQQSSFHIFEGLTLRWLLGFRKLRSSKKIEILLVVLVLRVASCAELFECALRTFCQNIFAFLKFNTNIKRARFEFYEKQILILGATVERYSGSICLKVNCQACSFTNVSEDFGHIFLTCSNKFIKILKVGKIFRCVTFYQYFFRK